ncbi:MAG: NUDIX domain-containing protein [Actinomycetota bacterium]|nr:NUDIX domain-containing protein [Actinomycetota bacterium]
MDDEIIEVVDDGGVVTGTASRAVVRAQNLWHRTAFVVVRSSVDDVLAHRRALTSPLAPGRWDLGFGGACGVGETLHAAAARELWEEAGIRTTLRQLTDYRWDGEETRETGRLYETRCDGPFTHPADEVEESRFVSMDELDKFIAGHDVLDAALQLILPVLR